MSKMRYIKVKGLFFYMRIYSANALFLTTWTEYGKLRKGLWVSARKKEIEYDNKSYK